MKSGRYENEDLIEAKKRIKEAMKYAKCISNSMDVIDNISGVANDIVFLLENSLKLLER